jgi:2-keto-4-pentenoate hydratase/2-oxohepta-3-ene-1,7-dioic acid hydratase in catechol pathway
MKAGVARVGEDRVVVMPLGSRWLNVTRLWADYNENVEAIDPAPLRCVGDLVRRGYMNRSFYRRVAEYAQRHGRLDQYSLEGEPDFCLPLRPGKIIAIGRNYRAHAEELGNAVPEEPLFFCKSPTACIGPKDPIVVKDWYGRVDHEGELAVVIGAGGKDIAHDRALEHVAGYTLLNDVTARDMQKADKDRGHPWYRSKNLDTFCPVGPLVAFRETLSQPLEVDVTTRVNGEVRQQGNTRQFLFDLETLIAHVSRYMTLEPGDLIATGTPEGVGPLQPGDSVEVECPDIGVLHNPVTTAQL